MLTPRMCQPLPLLPLAAGSGSLLPPPPHLAAQPPPPVLLNLCNTFPQAWRGKLTLRILR